MLILLSYASTLTRMIGNWCGSWLLSAWVVLRSAWRCVSMGQRVLIWTLLSISCQRRWGGPMHIIKLRSLPMGCLLSTITANRIKSYLKLKVVSASDTAVILKFRGISIIRFVFVGPDVSLRWKVIAWVNHMEMHLLSFALAYSLRTFQISEISLTFSLSQLIFIFLSWLIGDYRILLMFLNKLLRTPSITILWRNTHSDCILDCLWTIKLFLENIFLDCYSSVRWLIWWSAPQLRCEALYESVARKFPRIGM